MSAEGMSVLCADAEPESLRNLERSVRACGHVPISAVTAGQAFEILAMQQPALIVTEHDFGELAGMNVVRAMHRASPEARMIVYCRRELDELRPERKPHFVHDVIQKPAEPADLRRSIGNLLNQAITNFSFLGERQLDHGEKLSMVWRDYHARRNRLKLGRKVMNNIRHAVNQGMGVGGIIMLMDMLEMCASRDG